MPDGSNGPTDPPVDFEKLESLQLALADRVALKGRTADRFREYIDHGEYGLALDEIGVGMFDAGRVPNEHELASFRQLAEMMDEDADAYIALARSRGQMID